MWGLAAEWAGLFAGIALVLDILSSKATDNEELRWSSTIGTAVVSFLVMLFFDWVMIYKSLPVFAAASWTELFFLNGFIVLIFFAVANGVTGRISMAPIMSVVAILGMLVTLGVWNEWPLKGHSDTYGHIAQVAYQPIGEYPPTSNNNMVTVGDQNAQNIADRAMGQFLPGTRTAVGSIYKLGNCDLQSVAGHMYYICTLQLTGTVNNRGDQYTVGAYIVVDAQDPNVDPVVQTSYTTTDPVTKQPVKHDIKMIYTPGAPFEHSLDRHVYNNGYRNVYVDDLTLEVNDQWQPFYTASTDTSPVRWQQSIPTGFIVVDPESGAITPYDLNHVPSWVDRVYSKDMARFILSAWGEWGVKSWSAQGSGGRFNVDGEPTLVYTDQGLAWQMLLTSQNNDSSVSYVALMDTRDTKVRLFTPAKGQVITIQSKVTDAIENETFSASLKGDEPTNLALHEIDGELVWVAPLVPKGTAGNGQPEQSSGIALLSASDPNSSGVIADTTKEAALQDLAAQIANGDNNTAPGANSATQRVTGVIASVNQVTIGGKSYVIMMLQGDNKHVYQGQVVGGTVGNLEMALAKVGDNVTLTYVNTGSAVLNVSAFTSNTLAGTVVTGTPSPSLTTK